MLRMPRQVLATLDGSALSEAVLPYLPAVLRHGDEVVLLNVAPPPRPTTRRRLGDSRPLIVGANVEVLAPAAPVYVEDRASAIARIRAEMLDYLADRGLLLRNEGFTVHTDVVIGEDPARAIVDYARDMGPLFIAMATHGRGGIGHAITGSVTEEVVRSRVAPVLVVRP